MGKQSRKKQESRDARALGLDPAKNGSGRRVPDEAFGSKKSLPVFWIVVALIGVVALVALATLGGDSKTVSADKFRAFSTEIVVDGDDLPDYPATADGGPASKDPAVGKRVPSMTGQNPKKGKPDVTISTEEAGGKPFVVMFMAHWCPHCNNEVPRLVEEWDTNGKPKDIALFAVATDNSPDRPNFPAGRWLEDENFDVPTMLDDDNMLGADVYGIKGYPFFVFVNADGTVNYRVSGEIPISEFNKQLDALRANAKKASAPAKDTK